MPTASPAPTLEDAIVLAVEAHAKERDQVGRPYALHPLRVMLRLDDRTERMAAVLHDLVRQPNTDVQALRTEGYPPEVLDALDCLIRRPGEGFQAWVGRIERNALARRVKIADLEDDMDLRHLTELTDADVARLRRYLAAWSHLTAIECASRELPPRMR